jgi:hypothetical protein
MENTEIQDIIGTTPEVDAILKQQYEISEWAEKTFGPSGGHLRRIARALEEAVELLRFACNPSDLAGKDIADECADVYIVLCRVATKLGLRMRMPDPEIYSAEYPGPNASLVSRATFVVTALCQMLMNCNSREQIPEDFSTAIISPKQTRYYEFMQKALQSRLDTIVTQLYWMVKSRGYNLLLSVERKMQVNYAREWNLDGTGHGYHK